MTKIIVDMNRVIKTIGRSATKGSPRSGRFYAPLDVLALNEGTVGVIEQGEASGIALWPDEAKALGLALIEAAVTIENG